MWYNVKVFIIFWACIACLSRPVASFTHLTTSSARSSITVSSHSSLPSVAMCTNNMVYCRLFDRSILLYSSSDDELSISESDQGVIGAIGSLAALVTLYSEYTLNQTGCGLPAGPLGLVGLVEGLSYVTIVGIVGFSLFTKVKTGSGLPSGPAGLLGAAEGLSYLAALVGVIALVLQLTNFGYIPNAIPIEGGMCS